MDLAASEIRLCTTQLTFVDLEPAPACAEPLDEFRFRAMLGYLAEVSPLDPKLMADFVTDPELQWLATVRYGLSNSMLQGDLPGSVRGIKDLENLLHALRSVSYRVWLSCQQIRRLLAQCSRATKGAPPPSRLQVFYCNI